MDSGESILVVHGDQLTASRISGALEVNGYEVTVRYSAHEGLKNLYETHPDLVIIEKDAFLEEASQSYLSIREEVYIPLIAVGSGRKEVELLQMGFDAYLEEPLSLRELVARVNSILRRKKQYRKCREDHSISPGHVDDLLDGSKCMLTKTEFRLLSCLVMNTGELLPYARLLSDVWGRTVSQHTLHQCVRRVRQKLGIDSVGPPYRLINYRGEGYCFARMR